MAIKSGTRSVRYFFRGALKVGTVLHIGSGDGDDRTDACVVKVRNVATGEAIPIIPGSSLKGALRSHVERVAAALGIDTCQLDKTSGSKCLSVDKEFPGKLKQALDEGKTMGDVLNGQNNTICTTCGLFGSPYGASKVIVRDLPLITELPGELPVRDGVGIDRDTGTAKHGIKYDYEYLPPGSEFRFELILEDPEERDLGLLCIGLREMKLGNITLGGKGTRGAGKCTLELVEIEVLDRGDAKGYLDYLLNGCSQKKNDLDKFVNDSIKSLLSQMSAARAEDD